MIYRDLDNDLMKYSAFQTLVRTDSCYTEGQAPTDIRRNFWLLPGLQPLPP